MPDKLLITGGTGLLGSELAHFFSTDYDVYRVSSRDFDIRDYGQVEAFFNRVKPNIVLHAAAMVNVDACEADKVVAYAVNATGTEKVARACRRIGSRMVYYSTDYVFDGTINRPYTEADETGPVNIYGESKLEGEKQIASILDNYAILRVAWLYGGHKRSFINGLIKKGQSQIDSRKTGKAVQPIEVVLDQIGTPTWTLDVARQTERVLEKKLTGLFHCTARGESSRYNIAEFIFNQLSMDVELTPCSAEDFAWRANRPKYTPLANKRLNDIGHNVMRDYKAGLVEFLEKFGGM